MGWNGKKIKKEIHDNNEIEQFGFKGSDCLVPFPCLNLGQVGTLLFSYLIIAATGKTAVAWTDHDNLRQHTYMLACTIWFLN